MTEHISILKRNLKSLERKKLLADALLYDKEQINKEIEAFKAAIKALEQEPCEKAISRSDMLDAIGHGTTYTSEELQEIIKGMPPVNPQEPKTGHWIVSPNECFVHCSDCGLHGDIGIYKHYGWCPNCGARMVEPQESEVRK